MEQSSVTRSPSPRLPVYCTCQLDRKSFSSNAALTGIFKSPPVSNYNSSVKYFDIKMTDLNPFAALSRKPMTTSMCWYCGMMNHSWGLKQDKGITECPKLLFFTVYYRVHDMTIHCIILTHLYQMLSRNASIRMEHRRTKSKFRLYITKREVMLKYTSKITFIFQNIQILSNISVMLKQACYIQILTLSLRGKILLKLCLISSEYLSHIIYIKWSWWKYVEWIMYLAECINKGWNRNVLNAWRHESF